MRAGTMRKILLSAALLAASVAHAQTTSYTLADVAKHATATDCWMVLNTNKVYNFTPFVSMHPGGSSMVRPTQGLCTRAPTHASRTNAAR